MSIIFTPPPCGAIVAIGVWKQFMCHNLGAANPSADPFTPSWEINGGYWQWGRKDMASPGPSGPGADQTNVNAAGWKNIYTPNGSWSDAVKTSNDPCPAGYRVPTRDQWIGVISYNSASNVGGSWTSSSTNYTTGKLFGDQLFLPAAGLRSYLDGSFFWRGSRGVYWSSSEGGSYSAWSFGVSSVGAGSFYDDFRASGLSIRCIAE